MCDVNTLMVDVRMNCGLRTVGVTPNTKCSFIMESLDIDPAAFYMVCGVKALDWNRLISDYDFPGRFSVEVIPILHGGGKYFVCFCFMLFVHVC